MIYQPRNVQPSNSAVDGNKDNIFTMEAQTNSYISSYQLLISDFNNDDIYIGDKTDLASYAYNGDTISIPVNADTVKLSNGSDYKWRVKLYQPTADMLITYGLVQQTSTETNIYTQPNINIREGMTITINGQTQVISSYNVDTGVAVVATAFSEAPNVGAQYIINSDFIETVPDYIVYARETPTVSINNIPSSLTLKYNTFQGVYNQSDNVPIVYHQFDLYLQNADGSNTLIDTSGKVYSANLSYTYNSFRTGNTYAIQMTVENDMGIVVSTDLYSFNVSYDIVEYLQQPQATFNSQQNAVKISWVAPVENEAVSTLSNVASGTVQNNNNTDTTAYFEPGQVISQGDIVRLINSDFNLKVDGKSQQVTTTGQQLYNYKDTNLVTSGITTDEDGWITVTYDNSQGTGTKFFNYFTNNLNLKANTQYQIVTEIKEVNGELTLYSVSNNLGQMKYNTQFDFNTPQENLIYRRINETYNSLSNSIYGLRTYVQFLAGKSGSITFRISVLNDTSVTNEFSYEPFSGGKPSPSPDYPQEVEVVRGKNILPTDISDWEQGTLTTQGANSNSTTRIRTIDYYNIKTGIDYYISVEDTNYSFVNIFLYDKNKTFVVSYSSILNISGTQGTKINIPSSYNVSYMRVILQKSGATTITADEVENIKPMIVKGSTKIDFEPYNSIVAKSNGKNLFKTTPINSGGMTVKMDKNGILTINGTAIRSWADVTARFNIELPIDTYAFSIDRPISLPMRFKGAYDDGTIVEYEIPAGSTYIIKTIPKKIKTLYVFIFGLSAGVKVENLSFGIQIEEGTMATEYEPYQESKLTFNLNTEQLCSITDVADELNIDLSNGNYNKTENITKVVLDGSEEGWEYNSTYKYFRCPTYNYGEAIPLDLKGTQKCNYFQIIEDWATFRDNINKNSIFRINNEGYKICIRNTTYTTVEEFKQWLSENPVEVYYQLETPITTQLGTLSADDLAKFNSINGTAYMNIITNIDTNYYLVYPSTLIMKSTNQNLLFNPAGKSQTITINSYNKVTGAIDLMNNSKFLYIPVQGDAYQVIGNIYNETGFQILYNTPYNSVNSLYTHGYTATWAAPDGLCVLPDDFNITLQFSPDSNFYYNSDGTYQEVVNLITANTDDALDNGDFAIKIDKNKLIFMQNPDINLELPFYTNTTQVFVLSPDSAPQINNDYIWDDSATWNDTYIWVEGGTSIERVCNHWWKVQITNTTIKIEEIFPTS